MDPIKRIIEHSDAEEEIRKKVEETIGRTVCFTGHRPDKLIGGYSLRVPLATELANVTTALIESLIIENQARTFISGGALGFDQIAFMCVDRLKKKYPEIQNILAVPFKDQPNAWKNPEDVKRYEKIVERADEVVYVDVIPSYIPKGNKAAEGRYSAAKMQMRNQYMVDQSDLVIAAWDGSSGGTKNCVDYAKRKGKRIVVLDPKQGFARSTLQ